MKSIFSLFSSKKALTVSGGIVVAIVVTVFITTFFVREAGAYPEVDYIAEHRMSFQELSDYLSEVAGEKGGGYAFGVLLRAPLPSNVDTHLLGHVIGDELYEQEGLQGIEVCTQDFRNACSHAIVVGALLERGERALQDIGDICRQAPGGTGAYTMCFHGLGHGVLAYTGYELEKAVQLCQSVGTAEYNNREYIECVGGTLMELTGGVHDVETRIEMSRKYFKKNDPLAPCNASFMPADAQPMCYTYLTPHLFEEAGANLGFPRPDDYDRAFEFCDKLAANERANREACFGGFGKEFVVLAQDRDVRDIASISNERLERVFSWCELADVADGIEACMKSALASLYWGGENDRNAAVRFCSLITVQPYRDACHRELIDQVGFYIDDVAYREAFCTELHETHRASCRAELL